jgi:hypothetical protein
VLTHERPPGGATLTPQVVGSAAGIAMMFGGTLGLFDLFTPYRTGAADVMLVAMGVVLGLIGVVAGLRRR